MTTRPHTATTVRHVVLDLLRAFGMTTIFGNLGSTELSLFLDFPDDFRYVLGLQESVVVGLADGFAQASHNAAFVNLHSAARVGHAMGNIFTAYKNCTPMVITAGQQAWSILPFDPFLYSNQPTEFSQTLRQMECGAGPCWCRFRPTTDSATASHWLRAASALNCGLNRQCWR